MLCNYFHYLCNGDSSQLNFKPNTDFVFFLSIFPAGEREELILACACKSWAKPCQELRHYVPVTIQTSPAECVHEHFLKNSLFLVSLQLDRRS